MSATQGVFLVMVFMAVFLLAYMLVVPAFGPDRQTRKRLKKRLSDVVGAYQQDSTTSILRENYLKNLSPTERWLETLPGMASLGHIIEQSGKSFPAYRVVLASILFAVVGGLVAWTMAHVLLVAFAAGSMATLIPYMKIVTDRNKRMGKFEEQLPDALDVMTRAMRAGHPFVDAVKLVGEELEDPVAKEFELTFADINYGSDTRVALLNLLERIPSVNVLVLVTSVLVQREVGGNLTEILEKISSVIRSRFRFQRRVRTLSAEGRLSAWILALIPFVLVVMLQTSSPGYLVMLTDDPLGQKLIAGAVVLMIVGLFWISRIIRIQA
jgi:tight adherence protein B